MSQARRRLLCFGLGYSARVLAARLAGDGWLVAGTSRQPGAATHRFERGHPLAPTALAGVSHILVSVPPDGSGDPVLDRHGGDIAALPGLAWLGYLSTTGVYGHRGRGWVAGRAGSGYRPCREPHRLAAAAAHSIRGGRAVADGEEFLRRQQAGLERADQSRARRRAALPELPRRAGGDPCGRRLIADILPPI